MFIETVRPGGLAEDYGLGLGDQIVKVNGKSFIDIKHEEVRIMSYCMTKATNNNLGFEPSKDSDQPLPMAQSDQSLMCTQ